MQYVFIYITCPDKNCAKKISNYLLENRLAACTNIFPIESMYTWNSTIVSEKEYVIIVKTLRKLYNHVEKNLSKIHPYKIPCITMIPVIPNKKYREWMIKACKS